MAKSRREQDRLAVASRDPQALARLIEAERRLEALGSALEISGDTTAMAIVAVAVGRRARSLYLGVQHAVVGPSEAAAQVALRALIEQSILLPWLLLNPTVHPFLWTAEHQRHLRNLIRQAPANAGAAFAAGLAERATPERIEALDREISRARALAVTHGVQGVRSNGSVIPSLAAMTAQLGTREAREAYHVAYNMTSGWTHTAPGGLGLSIESEGVVFDDDSIEDSAPIRSMAAATYLYILGVVSKEAGLGIEDETESLRRGLLQSA